MRERSRLRKEKEMVLRMDDRQLKDIGISRGDIEHIFSKAYLKTKECCK